MYFDVWSQPKKVHIEIPKMSLKHTFTNFNVEGIKKGRRNCKCFTATKKTVVMDDSTTLDALIQNIFLKK